MRWWMAVVVWLVNGGWLIVALKIGFVIGYTSISLAILFYERTKLCFDSKMLLCTDFYEYKYYSPFWIIVNFKSSGCFITFQIVYVFNISVYFSHTILCCSTLIKVNRIVEIIYICNKFYILIYSKPIK